MAYEQDERGRRCEAYSIVFEENTDKLRNELQLEVNDLNSKLLSKRLISETVYNAKDIDVTLRAIRKSLKNTSIAEKTFDGFRESLNDITSKAHLATTLQNDLDEKLKGEQVYQYTVASTPATQHQVSSSVMIGGSSTGQSGGAMPLAACDTLETKVQEATQDSVISGSDTEAETTAIQTTDETPDYEVMGDASGTILPNDSMRLQNELLKMELEETKKMLERAKKGRSDSIKKLLDIQSECDKKNEGNKELFFSHQQSEEEYEKLQQELIATKTEHIKIREQVKQNKKWITEYQRRDADHMKQIKTSAEKSRQAEEEAKMAEERVGKLVQKMEQYEQEAANQKGLVEQMEKKVELAEEREEKLAQKLKQTEEQIRMLTEKLKETEKETQKHKQDAADRIKQLEKELKLAVEREEKIAQELKETKEDAQKYKEDLVYCKEQAEQTDEKAAQLLQKFT